MANSMSVVAAVVAVAVVVGIICRFFGEKSWIDVGRVRTRAAWMNVFYSKLCGD